MNTDKLIISVIDQKHELLTTIFYYSLEKDKAIYAVEGNIFYIDTYVKRLLDNIEIIDTAAKTGGPAKTLSSNEGVYLVPAFIDWESHTGTPILEDRL